MVVYISYSNDFIIVLPTTTGSIDDVEAIIKRFKLFKNQAILEL